MKILIATGIYPPALGGPAKYAENLKKEWEKMGHKVVVKTFTKVEHILPSLVRHIYYFLKIIPSVISCDFIYALDTFSVGWPATRAAKIFGKKILIRTGGDFLWEGHVERTGNLIPLKHFYLDNSTWSFKEKRIFNITKWVLKNASVVIFSTRWQRQMWTDAYELSANVAYIENFYGHKLPSAEPREKNFIAGTRKLKWKNLDVLKHAFDGITEAVLDLNNYPHDIFQKKISECYATILVSLGDISPNMILESIRYNKPFIITKENGLMDRISGVAITVDPQNTKDIREKIMWLCKKENYDQQVRKLEAFTFTHTWEEIAEETLQLFKKL